jgi:hypothetical protein
LESVDLEKHLFAIGLFWIYLRMVHDLIFTLIADEPRIETDPTLDDSWRKTYTLRGTPVVFEILDTAMDEGEFVLMQF